MSIKALADLLEEEMEARGWTARDVAIRLVMEQFQIEELALDMLFACRADPNIVMSVPTLESYAKVFGVSFDFFQNLYESKDVEPRDQVSDSKASATRKDAEDSATELEALSRPSSPKVSLSEPQAAPMKMCKCGHAADGHREFDGGWLACSVKGCGCLNLETFPRGEPQATQGPCFTQGPCCCHTHRPDGGQCIGCPLHGTPPPVLQASPEADKEADR